MRNYKVGDRIRRKDGEDYPAGDMKTNPTNWIGTITAIRNPESFYIELENGRETYWTPNYFEHYNKLKEILK